MKTTVELPDTALRQAKALAASRGITLEEFITEALDDKLRRRGGGDDGTAPEAPWMAGFGELSDLAGENRRIDALIADEFETLEPGDAVAGIRRIPF